MLSSGPRGCCAPSDGKGPVVYWRTLGPAVTRAWMHDTDRRGYRGVHLGAFSWHTDRELDDRRQAHRASVSSPYFCL